MTKTEIEAYIKENGGIFAEMKEELLGTSHEVIFEKGIPRWKKDENYPVDNLNDLVMEMLSKGLTPNDEAWRDVYRKIGYSLYGYWEVFYWEANNEDAEEYSYEASGQKAKKN
jgi:hypothetical protein